jgi:hypothetical protein
MTSMILKGSLKYDSNLNLYKTMHTNNRAFIHGESRDKYRSSMPTDVNAYAYLPTEGTQRPQINPITHIRYS